MCIHSKAGLRSDWGYWAYNWTVPLEGFVNLCVLVNVEKCVHVPALVSFCFYQL